MSGVGWVLFEIFCWGLTFVDYNHVAIRLFQWWLRSRQVDTDLESVMLSSLYTFRNTFHKVTFSA